MSEQKFAALIDKALDDRDFARSMQTNPAQTLECAGYQLTAEEKESLRNPHRIAVPGNEDTPALLYIYPNVKPGPLAEAERKPKA